MRFFSQQWMDTEVDGRLDAVWDRYLQFIASTEANFPDQVQKLVRDQSLHDAVIETAKLKSRELALRLIVGDKQRGYRTLTIQYQNVDLSRREAQDIRAIVRDRRSEIILDEFDVLRPSLFVHRFSIWPEKEIEVRFSGLSFVSRDRPLGRVVEYVGDPFEES